MLGATTLGHRERLILCSITPQSLTTGCVDLLMVNGAEQEYVNSWLFAAPLSLGLRWSRLSCQFLANQAKLSTVLEVRHQLRRNSRPRQRLFQAPIESARAFHILFPNGKQKLDVSSLAHRFTVAEHCQQ